MKRIGLEVIGGVVLAVACSSCAARNIHVQARPDKKVMVREWVLRTWPTSSMEAGERGAEFSSPIPVDQTLVFGSSRYGLISVYPSMKQIRWALPIAAGVDNPLLYANGAIYFVGGDGFFYSVNAETGRVNWRYEVRNIHASRPAFAGGRVFVTTSDDTVYAFDAGSGDWLWHYKRRSAEIATIVGASSPLVLGEEIFAGLSDGYLVSLSLQEGKLRWEKKLHDARKFTDLNADLVVSQNQVFVPSYDGALYSIDLKTKNILWKFEAGGARSVTLDEDRLYLPSSDGNIYALKKESGQKLWQFEIDDGTPTEIAMTPDALIFGSSREYLYLVEKHDGSLKYRMNIGEGSGFYSAPLYNAKSRMMYILSGAGNLYSFLVRYPLPLRLTKALGDPYE